MLKIIETCHFLREKMANFRCIMEFLAGFDGVLTQSNEIALRGDLIFSFLTITTMFGSSN